MGRGGKLWRRRGKGGRKREGRGQVEIWNDGKLSKGGQHPSSTLAVCRFGSECRRTATSPSILPFFFIPQPSPFPLPCGKRGGGQRLDAAHRWTVLMKRWRRSPGLVHERDTLRSLSLLPVEPLRGGEERLLWLAHQKPLHESRLKWNCRYKNDGRVYAPGIRYKGVGEREGPGLLVVRASFRIPKVRCTPYISFW